MKLTFVAAAIAVATTASAGFVERRTTHVCIPESQASVNLTVTGSPYGSCEGFTRRCDERHPEKPHVSVCKPFDVPAPGNPREAYVEPKYAGHGYLNATCVISFGQEKYSYTNKIAKLGGYEHLVPANSSCTLVKDGFCGSSDFSKRRQLICPGVTGTM